MSAIRNIFDYIKIPGVFWLALIAFAVAWLPQLMPGAPWLDDALLALIALGKTLDVLIHGITPLPAVRADAPPFDAWRGLLFG